MTAPTAGATEEAAGGVGNEGDLIRDAANPYASMCQYKLSGGALPCEWVLPVH